MLRSRFGKRVSLVATALLLAACSDSAVAPSGNDVVGDAVFARKPSSSPGNPGDNNSCSNNDSGNKTRNSPKDKNQCPSGPSFTLVFDKTDEGLANATYNPCPLYPFPFSEYIGELVSIGIYEDGRPEPGCIGNGLNLIFAQVSLSYIVTSAPDASCSYVGDFTWFCDVISPNTVITIAPASGSISGINRRLQDPISNTPKSSEWTWERVDTQGTKQTVHR